MPSTSPPSYIDPSVHRAPAYSYEPAAHEQRLALAVRGRTRPAGHFLKQSKGGSISLRLSGQEDNVALPVFVSSSTVDGTVEIVRGEGITRVEMKMEGYLKIREIGEGGHSTIKLCQAEAVLWSKDRNRPELCGTLPFSFRLPESFEYEDKTYPLPPTHVVKLSGFPGFTAHIDYSVSVLINKPNSRAIPSKAMGLIVGTTVVNTPFIYRPLMRPQYCVPPPLVTDSSGFVIAPGWSLFESTLPSKQPGLRHIGTKLYVPTYRTFHMQESIPFHLSLHSTAIALSTYLPLGPSSKRLDGKKPTRVQIMRQSTVDVRNIAQVGLRQDMWRVDCIGEGAITLTADAPKWIAYNGVLPVDCNITIPGFKAAGLSVKDCILFSINPPEPTKCPFGDLRQVIPIRLATDPWRQDGSGIGRPSSNSSSD